MVKKCANFAAAPQRPAPLKTLPAKLALALLGALLFVPFLGGVHLFDWDEINFAEMAREMLITGDYLRPQINFAPFWEKPPLFMWLQAAAMGLFGVNEFAARLPNALCGIATLLVLFDLGNRLYDRRFGWLWAATYASSILPHLYFRSGIIDPWFNLFIFLGLYGFVRFYWLRHGYPVVRLARSGTFYLLIGGAWVGLAMLTKGPVAYLIICLVLGVYWLRERFRLYVGVGQFLAFSAAALVVTLLWWGVETAWHGPWFLRTFFAYQYRLFSTPDAGHGGFPGYHVVVLLLGCFPASVFALRAMRRLDQPHRYQRNFRAWMLILFWVVLVLFTIVKSKIVHYSSLAYFPVTYLATLTLHQLLARKLILNGWLRAGLVGVAATWGLAVMALPWVGRHPEWLRPLLAADPFAVANLSAAVHWTGWEATPGVVLLASTLAGVYWLRRRREAWGVAAILGGSAFFVAFTLIFCIARIEAYSQGAAIRFYERFRGQDVYVEPYGFRTYGYLFYTDKQPARMGKTYDDNWLLHAPLDRDLYVIAKLNNADSLRANPAFQPLGEENGFVFFVRRR